MTNELDFSGKTVLVVGGSSGIGNGIAQTFRARGATVHVWGTRAAASDYAADEGSDLTGLHYSRVDVADRDAIDALVPAFDTLDILIQSQGTVVYRRGEFKRAGWDQVMAINLDSLMAIATKFRPLLAAGSGGSIVIVSSVAAYQSNIGNPAYSASKAGAVSVTRVLAKAWAREGIRVNGIAPGLVETKLTKVTTDHPDRLAATIRNIPDGRIGQTADMANVALFLTSPLASYVTGHTIVVDGGLTLT